eukprot:TRINITY_DN11843_c0_g1_i1.p1 TRINITY_DN11843_c0_g1~~TRINITY_DN11843_c0_g1_i1.p1  ORF type:complete len:442 (+),score=66.82 TRINITY_DN11843_c0_g1_i1:196-1326(+)
MAEADNIMLFWSLIMKYGLDIDEPNKNGYTPLMISIIERNYEQAEYLLEHGANPNAITTSRDGAIRRATFLEQTAMLDRYIKLLRKYDADFTIEDEHGNTVLNHVVAKYNNVDVDALAQLVAVNKSNHDNYTPLARAIHRSLYVEQLLHAGADVNLVAGPLLQSPLLMAIERYNAMAVCLLLDRNVDITVKDKAKRSFVHYLLLAPYVKNIEKVLTRVVYLLDNRTEGMKSYVTPENISFVKNELTTILSTPELSFTKTNFLLLALTDVTITRAVIEVLEIDANMEDLNGDTMLTLIHADTPPEVVDYLLTKANVNHQNHQKKTALMRVTEKNTTEDSVLFDLQSKLIAAGASLTIKNMWGLSPLDIEPELKQHVK